VLVGHCDGAPVLQRHLPHIRVSLEERWFRPRRLHCAVVVQRQYLQRVARVRSLVHADSRAVREVE
jgi:hypothetical protein